MPRSRKATSPQPVTGSVALLIGTRKGALILRGDRTRRTWTLSAPMFLGRSCIIWCWTHATDARYFWRHAPAI
jgi:hypothetical protein